MPPPSRVLKMTPPQSTSGLRRLRGMLFDSGSHSCRLVRSSYPTRDFPSSQRGRRSRIFWRADIQSTRRYLSGDAVLVSAIIERVHRALEEYGKDCSMEEVVGLCPDLTWNQVYLAIDYLNKTGIVGVALDPNRTYMIHLYPSFSESPPTASQRTPMQKAAS